MNKVNMLTVLTAVALLSLAPGLDAAPLVPREPDAFEEADDGDNKKPPDPRKTITDVEDVTARATKILDKLLRSGSKTTFPDGDGKTVRVLDLEIIKTTSSPNVRDTGINNPLKTLPDHSDGPQSDRHDGPITTNPVKQTEESGLSEVMDDTSTTPELRHVSGGPGAREELVKMLSALEQFHKLVNSTLSHRITIIPRGNGNGRNPAKKNKLVVTEGNLKSTTATTVVSGATSAKAGTDFTDPKLNRKNLKTSLSSAPKKPNKRVCFWKYCSQN